MPNIDLFFNPKNIAVIGASRTPGKLGYTVLESLKTTFKGKIYPVNPLATEIANIPSFSSVESIPDDIEAAIIAVKVEIVPEILIACLKKKIKAITIISSSFSDIGQKEREEVLKKILKGKDARVLGPAALGVYQPKTMDMLFLSKEKLKRPSEGSMGVISQSGLVGSIILDQIGFEGVGISKFISYGDGIDLNETSLLEYLGHDLGTRAIALYIESVSNGPEFIKVASKVSKIKPVVVLKGGKVQGGSADVYSAAFKQSGIIQAKTAEELIGFAKALSTQPALHRNRVAVVTNSRDYGLIAAAAAEQAGFELPELSKDALKALKSAIPEFVAIRNPLDLTAEANAECFQKAIEGVAKDKNIDALLVISLFQAPQLEEGITDVLRDAKIHGKPIVVCTAGSDYTLKQARRLESFGIPTYSTPEAAVAALAALREYGNTVAAPKPVEAKEEKKKVKEKRKAKKFKKSKHAKPAKKKKKR